MSDSGYDVNVVIIIIILVNYSCFYFLREEWNFRFVSFKVILGKW